MVVKARLSAAKVPAAVDHDALAVDEAGIFGGEEAHGAGDVARSSHPPGGHGMLGTATIRPSWTRRRAIAAPRPRELPATNATRLCATGMWRSFHSDQHTDRLSTAAA